MLQAFVFNELAIVVRHWYEVGERDEEHGARIEVVKCVRRPDRGSESTSQPIQLDGLIWRVDLFDLIGEEPGRMSRAHHHQKFEADGNTPSGRDWDDALSAAPFAWTEERLRDLAPLVSAAGAELKDLDQEVADVERAMPAIMVAARTYGPARCTSPERCRELTRDTTEAVRLMATQFRKDPRDPRLIARPPA